MHQRTPGLEDKESKDTSETNTTLLPSAQRKRNLIQQISQHTIASSLRSTINARIAAIQTRIWYVVPIAVGATFLQINRIHQKMQRVFCEDIPWELIPEQGCWANKSKSGVTWGDWCMLGMTTLPIVMYTYTKYTRKPIIFPLDVAAQDVLSERELSNNHKLITDRASHGSIRQISGNLNRKVAEVQSIWKDRSAFLTFFMGSKQIHRGKVFNQDISRKVSDFLGCPDLVDHPILRLTGPKKRN